MDFTELLSDTAISPYQSHFYSVYNTVFKVSETRSTFIEIISISVREKIETDQTPSEWFVVGLYCKEREIKIKVSTICNDIIRNENVFCYTEKNLANEILKYLPTLNMTW